MTTTTRTRFRICETYANTNEEVAAVVAESARDALAEYAVAQGFADPRELSDDESGLYEHEGRWHMTFANTDLVASAAFALDAEYNGSRPGYAVTDPRFDLVKWFPVEELEEARAICDALNTFRPKVRVRTPQGDGYVYTAPVVSHATGQVCFGVRLDSGRGVIAKHDESEVIRNEGGTE